MNTEMPAPIVDEEETTNEMTVDPAFLKAKGRFSGNAEERRNAEKDHVKRLAFAIFRALSRHGYVTIRAVGPFANHNAVKALTIATGYCAPKGIDLCFTPAFDEGNLGDLRDVSHVENVTAILYSVKGFKEWSETK